MDQSRFDVRVCRGIVSLLVLLVGAGCYSPGYRDCQFTCETGSTCPSGLTCAEGYCRDSTTPLLTCDVVLQPDAASVDPPDADPNAPDADPNAPDADPSTPDASSPGTPDASSPGTPDASSPGTPDASSPGMPDASSPGTPDASPTTGLCELNQPYLPPCGGPVLCAKSIDAVTVKARVIYAKDITAVNVEYECVFESNGENHWTQGNGGGDIEGVLVEADVIYVKDLKATTVKAIEIRAKSVP